MQTLHVPFGFNTSLVNNILTIFTGKIRLKTDQPVVLSTTDIKVATTRKGYTLLTWATTDVYSHQRNMAEVNRLICNTMVRRIQDKYINQYFTDDLPF